MPMRRWIWQSPSWPDFSYDTGRLLAPLNRARDAQGQLRGKAQSIGLDELVLVQRDVWTESAVATAAIEGETLDRQAVRSSVTHRLGLPPASHGQVSRNIDALLDVINDASSRWQVALTEARLIQWQSLICEQGGSVLAKVETGRYRTHPVHVVSGAEGRKIVHFEGPPAKRVGAEMNTFLDWFNESALATNVDGLIRAGLSHLWFESIHPFADGNGRVGRAILDMALSQESKSTDRLHGISIEIAARKTDYYDALNRATSGSGDATGWLLWFIETFADACRRSVVQIEEALVRTRFWNEHKYVQLNERQRKALARMLGVGPGRFEGGMTPRQYMAMTKANNRLTATRDLTDLVEKQLLVREGAGRSTFYNLSIPGWGWVNKSARRL